MDSEDLANPYQSPKYIPVATDEIDESRQLASRQGKRRQLWGMVATFAISGVVSGILPENIPISRICDLVTGLVFVLFVLRWCDYDRWERRISPWRFFTLLMVFFPGPLFMLPIYLITTRGFQGFVATAEAAIFFAILIAVAMVAEIGIDVLCLL